MKNALPLAIMTLFLSSFSSAATILGIGQSLDTYTCACEEQFKDVGYRPVKRGNVTFKAIGTLTLANVDSVCRSNFAKKNAVSDGIFGVAQSCSVTNQCR